MVPQAFVCNDIVASNIHTSNATVRSLDHSLKHHCNMQSLSNKHLSQIGVLFEGKILLKCKTYVFVYLCKARIFEKICTISYDLT